MAGDNAIRAGRPVLRSRAEAEALVLEVLRLHAESLLRVARRHSLCADDAQDAYQRGVEIFLKHARTLDAGDAHKWLHTVIKHEAMRIRSQRSRSVDGDDVDLDSQVAGRLPTPDEQLASFDMLTRSAEALQRLKPQEMRALWLKAQGHSYEEIAELCDWTFTKVNRCLTEGRRSFLDRYAAIGSGAECQRWEPVLSALADGEATARDLAGVRPHLRNCPACRAYARELRETTRRVAALLPLPPAVAAVDHGGLLARLHDSLFTGLQERVVGTATKLQTGVEAALPGKLAVVAAGAAAIGGGVAVERAVDRPQRAPQARTAAPARAASPRPAPVPVPAVAPDTPAPSAATPAPRRTPRAAPRRVVARRTATSEFGLSKQRAQTSSASSTAAKEFPTAAPSAPSATAATAAPIVAPAGASEAEQTAAAEFGGG